MRTSAVFGAKNFGYFETDDVSARISDWPVRTKGSKFFAILSGRLLWTVPYLVKKEGKKYTLWKHTDKPQ